MRSTLPALALLLAALAAPPALAQAGADSGSLAPGASWSHAFEAEGTFEYYCHPHPAMTGKVVVRADAAPVPDARVRIEDDAFSPAEIVVPPGTSIAWTNFDREAHTVTFVAEGETAEGHMMREHGDGHGGHMQIPAPGVGALLLALAAGALGAAWRRR